MSFSPRKRRWLLAGALILTLALAIWPDVDNHDAGSRVGVRHPSAEVSHAMGRDDKKNKVTVAHGWPRRPRTQEKIPALFNRHSWYVPPSPPPFRVVAPVRPLAPRLPFTYIGRLIEGEKTIAFLSKQDRIYLATRGETIDGVYRVDEINTRIIKLTYLPLNIQQTLLIGLVH